MKVYLITLAMIGLMVKAVSAQTTALNAEISTLIRPNWEFESFWAIPRVADTKPVVAVRLVKGKNTFDVRCLDLEYFEIKKTFKPKSILKREFLHKIMCKSINRAIANTNGLSQIFLRTGLEEVGLKFDFLNGWIEIVKIPSPPEPEFGVPEVGAQPELHQQNT